MHAQFRAYAAHGDRQHTSFGLDRRPEPIDIIDLEIEDTGPAEFQPRRVVGRAWRLWFGVAVAMGIGGLTVVGALTDDPARAPERGAVAARATAPSGPTFRVSSPADGEAIDGAIVRVRGTATGAHARVQLAVVVGGAVLGSTVVETGAGPFVASIPVFAPSIGVSVELVGAMLPSFADGPFTTQELLLVATVRRPLTLRPAGPVGLWPARVQGAGRDAVVVVAGCAPLSVGRLEVRLVGRDGRVLATTETDITRDAHLPGAAAGYALGVGSFEARLAAGEPIEGQALRVEVDWRDEAGGSWGTSAEKIPPDALGRSRR